LYNIQVLILLPFYTHIMFEITAGHVIGVGLIAGGIVFAYVRHAIPRIRQRNQRLEIISK